MGSGLSGRGIQCPTGQFTFTTCDFAAYPGVGCDINYACLNGGCCQVKSTPDPNAQTITCRGGRSPSPSSLLLQPLQSRPLCRLQHPDPLQLQPVPRPRLWPRWDSVFQFGNGGWTGSGMQGSAATLAAAARCKEAALRLGRRSKCERICEPGVQMVFSGECCLVPIHCSFDAGVFLSLFLCHSNKLRSSPDNITLPQIPFTNSSINQATTNSGIRIRTSKSWRKPESHPHHNSQCHCSAHYKSQVVVRQTSKATHYGHCCCFGHKTPPSGIQVKRWTGVLRLLGLLGRGEGSELI